MMSEETSYDPTYREQDVDETLDNHDTRLSRLEKVALLGIGYGLAEGNQLIQAVFGFF
jgi:hypothetical protein